MSLPPAIGPYLIEDTLGFGGMGEVLRGRHRLIDRVAAIKIRKRTRDKEEHRLAARFRHTATLQAELDHPHIARVLDYIEQPTLQALVLSYLGGGSVADLLLRGPLNVADTMVIGIRAAEALAYAHDRGIVHRDIKPDNLMLQTTGDPNSLRITDFGIAKTADRSPDLTVAGANVGTVWYMSPEQFNHETPTPSFDIYGLGATLYEMLTAQVAFGSKEPAAVFTRFLDGVPAPPLRDRAPHVSPALAALIESAIALPVNQRPPTAAAFALLLRAVAEVEGISLDDQDASQLFHQADGAALRQMLQQLPQRPSPQRPSPQRPSPGGGGADLMQAFTHLDTRINGAAAITRLDLPLMREPVPILEVMLDDEIDEEDEDHTLVMPVLDLDGDT